MCFQLLLLKATLCAKSLAAALCGTFAKHNILEDTEMPNQGLRYASMLYSVVLWT